MIWAVRTWRPAQVEVADFKIKNVNGTEAI